MSGASANAWSGFVHDPREPAHAALRAGDRDRDHALLILHEAFADGRLDSAEFDERADAVGAAKTLGELPPLLTDVVPPPTSVVPRTAGLTQADSAGLRAMAEATYRAELRQRVGAAAATAALCWVIWAVLGFGFVWPAIVTAVVVAGLVKKVAGRDEEILDETRRLEKKQRRALKPPEQPMGDTD